MIKQRKARLVDSERAASVGNPSLNKALAAYRDKSPLRPSIIIVSSRSVPSLAPYLYLYPRRYLSMNRWTTILYPDRYVPMSDYADLFLYVLATSLGAPKRKVWIFQSYVVRDVTYVRSIRYNSFFCSMIHLRIMSR